MDKNIKKNIVNYYNMLSFFKILLLVLVPISSLINNENLTYFVNLSQSSYCIDDINFNCKTCSKDINRLKYIIDNNGLRVLMGYHIYSKKAFISFRGSENIKNWINNVKFIMVYPYNLDLKIGIEMGFHNLLNYIKEDIYKNLEELVLETKNNEIMITGHSLGGALGTLFALDILLNNNSQYIIDYLVTFGSPRVGNKYLYNYFKNSSILNSYRVTHANDIVPHLPLKILDYHHIKNEIWFNEDNSNYIYCDGSGEDKKCSNSCGSISCISINDHLNYLNTTMGDGKNCEKEISFTT